MDPLLILQTFGVLLERGDADGAAALFAEDARYDESPQPPLDGRAALRAFIADFAAHHRDVRFSIGRAIGDVATGRVAIEFRWEYTRSSDGERRAFDGMAFVEFREGLIAWWRGFSAPVAPSGG